MKKLSIKWKAILFFFLTTIVFYFLSVITSIVDPSFNLDNDFCNEWYTEITGVDRNTGDEHSKDTCLSFKNQLLEQMYYYNLGVSDRRLWWLGAEAVVITFFALYLAKKVFGQEERQKLYGNSIFVLGFACVIVGAIGSFVLSLLLPPPSTYLPFITFQVEQWEESMKEKILTGEIYITSEGKVIK